MALLVAGLAQAGTNTPPPSPLDAQIAALENTARARPADGAARAGALLATMAPDAPQRLAALTLQGMALGNLRDADGVNRVVQALESLRGRQPLADATIALIRANLASRIGPLRLTETLATEALAHLPPDAPTLLHYQLLTALANAKESRGKLDESLPLQRKALLLAESLGAVKKAEALVNLAYGLFSARQVPAGQDLARQALTLAQQSGDHLTISKVLNVQAFFDSDAKNAAAELKSMQGSLDQARLADAPLQVALCLANLADHYLQSGDFETALKISHEAVALNDPGSMSVALLNTGEALIGLHQLDEGLRYARAGLVEDQRKGDVTELAHFSLELGGYLERAGFLKEAVQIYKEQRQLAFEASQREQQQAILDLQEGNDADRRQRELDLLQRENTLKQAEVDKQVLTGRLWAAGAVASALLVALAGLLVRRLRRHNEALREGNALLQTLSEQDALTGLGNRRFLQRVLQAEDGSVPHFEASLLLIDIDDFKRINDRFGHAAGDQVLVETARRLRSAIHDGDTLVRWGGEEFLVVAKGLASAELERLAQRVLAAIGGKPVLVDGHPITVTASIGHARFPIAPTQLKVRWERALALVDTAMYLAKAHGRNLAYGVREVAANDETELTQISHGLEAAWQDGRVQLTATPGPAAPHPEPKGAHA
jgi:diguanylate cyclase (GGDEF)-like protein